MRKEETSFSASPTFLSGSHSWFQLDGLLLAGFFLLAIFTVSQGNRAGLIHLILPLYILFGCFEKTRTISVPRSIHGGLKFSSLKVVLNTLTEC